MDEPANHPAHEVPELDWYYGPTEWDQGAGKMWHSDCPAGRGEVWVWKDGSYTCSGCNAVQPPEGGWGSDE